MGCNIEEKFKRLEKARQHALEMEKETHQETEESQKGQQDLSIGTAPFLLS
jgi:hypothetical protein